jgi:hypothetical protein
VPLDRLLLREAMEVILEAQQTLVELAEHLEVVE